MTEDSANTLEPDFEHPKDAAEYIQKQFETIVFVDNEVDQSRTLHHLTEDVSGLLRGITEGKITQGQPRLARQLERISNSFSGKHDSNFSDLIGDCARFGLSAAGQDLTAPYRGKGYVSTLRK